MNLATFIEQLSLADTYSHPTEVITTIETHISVVFLTGEFAYKLKKPVNFGFLDFSTLEARKRFCELELTLNRRSAPDLYLDICPLYEQNGQLSFSAAPSQAPIEYVIKMRQFDPNLVLGRYLKQQTLNSLQVKQLAESIAGFHLHAEACASEQEYGHPDDVIHPMLDNFPHLLETFTHPEQQYRLRQLADWTVFTQRELHGILLQRKQDGYVRACHGDMHLDNITLLNDEPTLFDGIEFNEQFRWIDTMNDLAFLMIDLDNREQPALKNRILSQYLSITGDYEGLALLKFYQVYRSMVRSKITALRFHQLPVDSTEAKQSYQSALDYWDQAENDAYGLPDQQLIVMQGVSGTGKSHYAQQLLDKLDAVVISSDIERKRLYGIDSLHRVSEAEKAKLYSPEMNRKTYQRLEELAKMILGFGFSVIVDATFLKQAHRTPFQAIAEATQSRYKVLFIDAGDKTSLTKVTDNISQRLHQNDNPSDATVEIMRFQTQSIEPPVESEKPFTIKPHDVLTGYQYEQWLFDE